MTTRGTQTITWDVENRVIGVTGGASFVYDGDGNRVKKIIGSTTTIYVNKYYEKTGTEITTYYYLGDRLIAQNKAGTLNYFHQDSLGSTSVISNSSGTQVSSVKYLSFGIARSGTVSAQTDIQFTGQRKVSSNDSDGLYYYGARYYDADIGRFISPDTVIPAYTNPQGLNRYSYVLNNPLKFNDPTGHYWSNPFNVLKGIGISIYNTVKAIKDMIVNPLQTFQNLKSAINSPNGTFFTNIKNDYATKWNSETGRGEIVGEVAFIMFTTGDSAVVGSSSKVAKVAKITGAIDKEASIGSDLMSVYRSFDETGNVNYVGISNNVERRAIEQLREKGIQIEQMPGMSNLSFSDAKAVEQNLIEYYGLEKNGGTLMNKINSIAESNPIYDSALQRGQDILWNYGYYGY